MRVRLLYQIAGPAGVFEAGSVVDDSQMPRQQLEHLVERGYAKPVGEVKVERAVTRPAPETADIKHVGHGVYELPDGRRIKGKAAALAATEE